MKETTTTEAYDNGWIAGVESQKAINKELLKACKKSLEFIWADSRFETIALRKTLEDVIKKAEGGI